MKKIFTKLIMLFIILALIISCNKKTDIVSVEGVVLEYYTKKPIEGVRVKLRDGMISTGDGVIFETESQSLGNIDSVFTDKNGKFHVEVEATNQAAFGIKKKDYSFDPNWEDGVSVGVTSFNIGHHSNEVFYMKATSLFSPILMSASESYDSDTLTYEILERIKTGGFYHYIERDYYREGPFETGSFTRYANKYQLYRLTLKRGGIETIVLDSIYLKPLITFNDTIYY